MSAIWTTKGFVAETELVRTEGVKRHPNSVERWTEWHLDGELVKRDATVEILKMPQFLTPEVLPNG